MRKTTDMKPSTEFGKWLFNNLMRHGLTCQDVAKRLHSTRQGIRNHVNGKTPPSYVWVMAYCTLFNEDPDVIWERFCL